MTGKLHHWNIVSCLLMQALSFQLKCISQVREGCPIHPICNGSSKGLTVRHGSFNPSTQNDDPSTGSHFARDLEKIHYIAMREGRNVVGPIGSSRSVSDGDDPSTGSHFDCLSCAWLFGNSALSCIKMNVCGCILLERGIYTCTLLACALLRI